MPTPKILIVLSCVPLFDMGGISLVPVTHRDTTGDGCSCDTCSIDPKSGSDYRVVLLLYNPCNLPMHVSCQ